MIEVLSSIYYTIFPIDFKPDPVKVETTVSRRPFLLRYFLNPAIVAAEVGSMKWPFRPISFMARPDFLFVDGQNLPSCLMDRL